MSATTDRPSIAQPRMHAPESVSPALGTWMGVAIAAHRFEHADAPSSASMAAPVVDALPTGRPNTPAWPAFRAAARPKHARYLSFADQEHLLRYARARSDIPS